MKSKSSFEEFFNKELKPNLTKNEEQRKIVHKKNMTYFYFVLFISISLIIYILLSKSNENGYIIVFILLSIFIANSIIQAITTQKFKNPQKELIKNIVNFTDENLEYYPQKHIAQYFYEKSMLSPENYNEYIGDDLIRGSSGEINFEFCEIKTKYSDNDTKKNSQTVFHGIFFMSKFNKSIDGYVQIKPNRKADLIEMLPDWIIKDGKKIDMDYPEFESIFDVYSNSQIDSRYILTHSTMQRFIELHQEIKRPMRISIIKDRLYIAVSYNRELFELTPHKKLDDVEFALEYFNIINSFVNIVKTLKIDN